jgi:hypothetical protein
MILKTLNFFEYRESTNPHQPLESTSINVIFQVVIHGGPCQNPLEFK